MNIRVSQPVQYVITLTFRGAIGQTITEVVRYGFPVEPTATKVRLVARNIEQGILRTVPGLEFISMEAVKV